MKNLTIVLAFLMTFSWPVSAQDFYKGITAFDAGDYATALKEWMPLAEAGGPIAQYSLGVMYDNGHGVPQDYAEAVKWYRLVAEQGDADAQTNLGNKYREGKGRVPKAMQQADKVKALVAAGVTRVQIQEQLGMSKASYYRCLKVA